MRLIEDFLIRSERKKDILVATLRYKNYAKDNEELVAQLSLIERGSELKSIRKALEDTPEIVDSLIELFWAVKDPTPNTKLNEFREEFYRRIAIANIRFRSSRTGWKSDRGRIYIIYGEPNDTESHPFDLDNRAYEIWYYYSPKRTFYFEDRWGDGTYELVRQE
ncbi:GWxTD domain-containing protein [bacterium]|nr:GWxTD domain-containing protein [bacterium]